MRSFAHLSLLLATVAQAKPIARNHGSVPSDSSDPIISLPYATYQGYHNTTSNLYVWKSIRFAADTSGSNRWREAQPPMDEHNAGVQDATEWPSQCPQATNGGVVSKDQYDPLQAIDDEDCLFLSVWAPDNVSLKGKGKNDKSKNDGSSGGKKELMPVLVWIHGGGWDHNSAREFDHTPMINATGNAFIGITIQYRLGIFGFLAHPDMAADNGLNAGITDARAALKWVREYVHLLGGDKDRVTIWGQSAGGGTVGHLIAAEAAKQGGKKEELFQGAMLSSPYFVPMGSCGDSFWKRQFEDFSGKANCTNDLECLRSQSTELLKTLNHEHYVNYTYSGRPSVFEPCIEGPGGYLQYNTVEQFLQGKVAGHAAIVGSNYADGSTFVPTTLRVPANATDIATEANTRLSAVLKSKWPLTDDQVVQALSLYPLDAFKDNYERGGVIFTDAVFGCASNWLANAYGEHGYRYLYAVADAIHARDNAYEFPFFYNTLSPYSSTFYQSFIGSMTSFVRSGPKQASPNTFQSQSILDQEGAWPAYTKKGEYKVLNLTRDTGTGTNVTAGYVGSGSDRIGSQARCDFWRLVRVDGGW